MLAKKRVLKISLKKVAKECEKVIQIGSQNETQNRSKMSQNGGLKITHQKCHFWTSFWMPFGLILGAILIHFDGDFDYFGHVFLVQFLMYRLCVWGCALLNFVADLGEGY